MRKNSRKNHELRPLNIETNYCPSAEGSVLFSMGDTRVICAVSFSGEVPDHAKSKGSGWLSAEYTLLPYSTRPRSGRRTIKPDGRSVEIQRLIGRSLRGILDLAILKGCALQVDCDVLQADGGTRTAAITGAYIALKMALSRLRDQGIVDGNPLISALAAVSVGYVEGELLLDLDYGEDSRAEVDLNVVMDGHQYLVDIQGTGEKKTFSQDQLMEMVTLAREGIVQLQEIQNKY